jgi:hypothetical protein
MKREKQAGAAGAREIYHSFVVVEVGIELRGWYLLGKLHSSFAFSFVFQIWFRAFSLAGLEPQPSYLHLSRGWDYRCTPPHPAPICNIIL